MLEAHAYKDTLEAGRVEATHVCHDSLLKVQGGQQLEVLQDPEHNAPYMMSYHHAAWVTQ